MIDSLWPVTSYGIIGVPKHGVRNAWPRWLKWWSIRCKSEGWGFKSSQSRDISCHKNFRHFLKNISSLYRQCSKTRDRKCQALVAQMVKHSVWNRRLGVEVLLGSSHFLSKKKLRHLLKNIRSGVENECRCMYSVGISNVNFTNKHRCIRFVVWCDVFLLNLCWYYPIRFYRRWYLCMYISILFMWYIQHMLSWLSQYECFGTCQVCP